MQQIAIPGESPGRTHLAVVLDRSGSMESIRDDVIGGFNAFLAAQKAVEGEATLTLVQFDSQDPFEVLADHVDLHAVSALSRGTFQPRGCTPLLDAVGKCILATELWVSRQSNALRPEHIVVVIVTDGQENASTEFKLERIRNLVAAKEMLGWQFIFLSADLAAFHEAGDIGIADRKRVYFSKDADGNREAFARTSEKVAMLRRREVADIAYDDVDREALAGGKTPPAP